jgi:two-component system nitrogen regulation response regulator NtrX
MIILGPRGRITVGDLPAEFRPSSGPAPALAGASAFDPGEEQTLREARERFEKWFIARRLQEHGNNVTHTAATLGLERSHLHRKLKAFGLSSTEAKGAVPAGGGSDEKEGP